MTNNTKVFVVLVVLAALLVAKHYVHPPRTESQKWEAQHNMSDPGDDPRMKAAEAEATRRWPEFAATFAKHEPGVTCAVKARFRQDKTSEWMWVQVDSLDGQTIKGVLDNDPVDVHNVKVGDHVTVDRTDTDDWLVSKNADIVAGGFTSKVLQQVESERGQK